VKERAFARVCCACESAFELESRRERERERECERPSLDKPDVLRPQDETGVSLCLAEPTHAANCEQTFPGEVVDVLLKLAD
jgi:hypothetical protein